MGYIKLIASRLPTTTLTATTLTLSHYVDFSLLLLLIPLRLSIDNDGVYEEALFRAHRRMAYLLAHGGLVTFPYLVLAGGKKLMQLRGQVACATDMMLFGYDQGVFSMSPFPFHIYTNPPGYQWPISSGGVVVTPDFLEVHDLVGPTKTKVLSTVAAIYDIGCFFGAILAFTVGERLGRKKSILLGSVIMAVGTILQASSYSLPQMFIGRIVLG